MVTQRKYPIGIQTFSEIIKGGYIYIDKTDLVWQMAHYAKYIFMNRPRRFGKSLLTTTLTSYFRGEREFFEGLKIMLLEKEWAKYPVLHLDLSSAKNKETIEELRDALSFIMEPYEEIYGSKASEKTPGQKLTGLITRAAQQSEYEQAVVIIDEYDAPLLDVLHKDDTLTSFRRVMQEFYQPLKANERFVKFCFIAGITKFSQLSIFSTINNLANVTMDRNFGAICGITEEELVTAFKEDIALLAEEYEIDWEGMHQKLKQRYDGYRFTERPIEIYNPYSLMKAFRHCKVDNYWFDSGTPTYLIRQMQHFRTDIMSLERMDVPSSAFDKPTEAMTTALPLLYQSGYLTIKDYDRTEEIYTLSIPNSEVRIGYTEGFLPTYVGLDSSDVQAGFAVKFWRALKTGDIDEAMRHMQAYLAGVPYVEGFKEKLKNVANKEGFYEYTMYLIFSMLNVYVRTQVKCAGGRVDMVVWMPETIYIFELKAGDTAANALKQIDDKSYAIPYQSDGRKVVKVGVSMNADTRTVEEWKVSNGNR